MKIKVTEIITELERPPLPPYVPAQYALESICPYPPCGKKFFEIITEADFEKYTVEVVACPNCGKGSIQRLIYSEPQKIEHIKLNCTINL